MHQWVLCGSIAISMVQLKLLMTYWCFLGPICSMFNCAHFLPDEDSSSEADWLMMKQESWVDECLGLAGWEIERMDCPFIPLLSLTRAWQVYLWHVTIGVNASGHLNPKRSQVTPWCEPTWWSSNSVPTLAREISQLYDEWRRYGNSQSYHCVIWFDAQPQPHWIKVLISTSMKTTSWLSLRTVSSRWPWFWLTSNKSRSWNDLAYPREATAKSERASWRECHYFATVNAVQG